MPSFPAVDPIPLPAPVWLMQILYHLTTALHFTAVFALTGGLIIALILGVSAKRDSARGSAAGGVMATLPTVMAYVVNLGVPPLLFSQVLYGRVLYTSTVLLGAQWIAVIPILIGAYFCLYVGAARFKAERRWTPFAGLALLGTFAVAAIYFQAMTLQLDPSAWLEKYRNSAAGMNAYSSPDIHLKGQVFMAALLPTTGALMLFAAMRRRKAGEPDGMLQKVGSIFLIVGPLLTLLTGFLHFGGQPTGLVDEFMGNSLGVIGLRVMQVGALGLVVMGVLQMKKPSRLFAILSAVLLLPLNGGITLVRGAFKDLTLLRVGYDVNDRAVASNWGVVVLFLLLLVGALGAVAWMAKVFVQSRTHEMEQGHV